ncbi:MAG: hypothetical protein K9N34_02045 [Candidatus Marinimicrobia bacterium]|nr:hypothetical protein [Candidatus Neomarinimicrobiota bacterium]MCF7839520.1 hypothetical protein [Candidatus Neomarinimicrobiota bacterium]MCF7902449.1 hypothetical protein [Candidatus Neomarinimicrobiota bacterium]
MRKLLVTGMLICASWSLLPGEGNLRGYLKSFAGVNTHHTARWERLYSHLQLQISGRIGERIGYRADLVARYNYLIDRGPAAPRTAGLALYPAELYVDYYGDWMDVRVGQQYLFWGRADWINPTDVFTPWDYTNMSSDIEDYRIPIPAVKLSIYPAVGHWELIYAPRLVPDKIPGPLSASVGDSSLNQAQFGMRYANNLSRIAWSAYAYRGWRKYPELNKLLQFVAFPFNHQTMLGGDFIYTGEQWAIKGESALKFSADRSGDDPLIDNDNIHGVLGIDWIPSEDFSLNIQSIVRHYLNFDRQAEVQTIQDQNMSGFIPPPGEATEYSISSLIRYKVSNFVNFQSIIVLNLADEDWFWLPFLSWEVADATHLTVGAILFDGPPGSDFGNSANADQVFIQFKTSF